MACLSWMQDAAGFRCDAPACPYIGVRKADAIRPRCRASEMARIRDAAHPRCSAAMERGNGSGKDPDRPPGRGTFMDAIIPQVPLDGPDSRASERRVAEQLVAERLVAGRVVASRRARRPTRKEAEAAVRTLIAWAGDDLEREGLRDTPRRVAKAYEEFFRGYGEDPAPALERTFEEVGGYDDPVLLRDIPFHSHCEHHMVPFVGQAHVAYFPGERVVGLSKLARVVDVYARRLQ